MIIRSANKDDLNTTFMWQSFPQIRRYCRNTTPPNYEEHIRWFNDTIENQYRDLMIAEIEGNKIAQLRVDRDNNNEVSILIAPEFIGKGIGQKVLSSLCDQYADISLTAKIHPDNKASVKIFLNCGFIKQTDEDYIRYPIE